MNIKRLILAFILVAIGTFATDFLIHGVWLAEAYKAKGPWRDETEMGQRFGWLLSGQLLESVVFTLLYAKGFAPVNCIRMAAMYGLFMGLFQQASTLIYYAVEPIPLDIAVKWVGAGLVQGVLLGVVVFLAYKPSPSPAATDAAAA